MGLHRRFNFRKAPDTIRSYDLRNGDSAAELLPSTNSSNKASARGILEPRYKMTPIQRFRSRSEVLSVAADEYEEDDECISSRRHLPCRFERHAINQAADGNRGRKKLSHSRDADCKRSMYWAESVPTSTRTPSPSAKEGNAAICIIESPSRRDDLQPSPATIDTCAFTSSDETTMATTSSLEDSLDTTRLVQFKKVVFVHNYIAGRKPESMQSIVVDGLVFKKKSAVRKLSLLEKVELYDKRPDLAPIYPPMMWPTEEELDELGEFVLAPLDATWDLAEKGIKGLHKGGKWLQQLGDVDSIAGDILLDCAADLATESEGMEVVHCSKVDRCQRPPALHMANCANSSLFDVECRDEADCQLGAPTTKQENRDQVSGVDVRGECQIYDHAMVGKLLYCHGWD